MASILGDGTGPGGPGSSRCLLLLQRSLAIQLTRGPPPHGANGVNVSQRESPKEHPADEMWMYDKGYNLFQVSRAILVHLRFTYISSFIPLISFYRASPREFKLFLQLSSINVYALLTFSFDARFFLLRRSLAPEKFCGNERRNGKRKRDVCRRRRDTVERLRSSCLRALFLPLVSTHGSFTVKRTLIARTVTPQ